MGKGKIPVSEQPNFYTSDGTEAYVRTRKIDKKWFKLPAYRYTSAEIGRKKNDRR